MGFLGARERLEPLGDLIESLFASGASEAGVHLGVLISFARDRGLQVYWRGADRLAGGRIADFFQEIEVAVSVAGLAFGRVAEQAGDVRVAFDVGLTREIKITPVGLRLAGESMFQVFVSLCSCKRWHLYFLH